VGYAPFMGKTDSERHRRILNADLRFRADFHLQARSPQRHLTVHSYNQICLLSYSYCPESFACLRVVHLHTPASSALSG
jgi:hypothetical protein